MSFPRYPAYKDSGVAWLGEVPEHWDLIPIKRILQSIEQGWSPQCEAGPAELGEWGVLKVGCVNGGKFNPDENKALPRELLPDERLAIRSGDVLVSRANTRELVGSVAIAEMDYSNILLCDKLYRLRTNQAACSPAFLARYLVSDGARNVIETSASGASSSMLNIGQSVIVNMPIALPPAREQADVVHFLDRETAKIDTLIAEQQRLIELLQEKRQAVISQAVTKGLNPDAPMKDSGVEWLGEVPVHWVVKKLKHLLSQPLSYGANEPADSSSPELPRYIRITDIQEDGTLNADTFRSLPAEKAEPYMLIDKDILLARSGATVGKAFLYKRELGPCCFAGYLILARLEPRNSLPEWFRLFAESSAYWGQVKCDAIQATIQNVSAEKYGNILVPVPPKDELVGIVRETKSLVEYFERTVSAAMRSISLLHERRSTLISAAVTGQIDVRGLVAEAEVA